MRELEDLNWFPPLLRKYQTEFIGFVVSHFNFYGAFVEYINKLNLAQKPLTDLCSGSGEPAISIYNKSNCFSSLLLTDKFPHSITSKNNLINYNTQPVDVLQLTFEPDKYYTMFNAFHHFSDEEKTALVRNLQMSGASAFFVEVLEPTVLCGLKVFLMATAGCLLLTPFIRPFSFKRLFFTYIFPVNIAGILFDGMVSVLKSRSVNDYKTLFTPKHPNISIQRFSTGFSPILMIYIHPTK